MLCQHCGAEYYGLSYSKFCKPCGALKLSRNARNRHPYEGVNQHFEHDFHSVQHVQFFCDLCGDPFDVSVWPKQFVYPRYCEEHRSEFKRQEYERVK